MAYKRELSTTLHATHIHTVTAIHIHIILNAVYSIFHEVVLYHNVILGMVTSQACMHTCTHTYTKYQEVSFKPVAKMV